MTQATIYRDIASRTGGDIYIGVVGPVRTGKSTFIKKFMESLVLPNIENDYDRQRTVDELPQSASGKTVMTTEPKFIPDDAVKILVGDSTSLRVKMVDCVGFIVPEALGQLEEGQPRMVHTPWFEEPLPFREAAEIGTQKVIREHSTIGMLVTTDGSIGEIPRESYVDAEERVAAELSAMNKPFAIILNSANPQAPASVELAYALEKKYNAPVALVNCQELDAEDICHILALVLQEFPVRELRITMPDWLTALDDTHALKNEIFGTIRQFSDMISKVGDVQRVFTSEISTDPDAKWMLQEMRAGDGIADISLTLSRKKFYDVLSSLTGFEIQDDVALMQKLVALSEMKSAYDKVEAALQDVEEKGYGIVMPDLSELSLHEPQIIRQSGSYGVRLKASARSIHMIKADIEAEINPIVGTEQQSEELIRYLMDEIERDPTRIWESNMFGKSLYELINESLRNKLEHMSEESRAKLAETLERIINEGSGGLICILL